MKRLLVCLASVGLLASGGLGLNAASAASSPNANANAGASSEPKPLPAHSQRPVCGHPAAGRAYCHAHVVTHQDNPAPLASVNYTSGWRPADLVSAYKLPTSSAHPVVAIVDAYDNPNAASDLATYRGQFGLGVCGASDWCFKKVNQAGVEGSYPVGDTGWGGEIDLDIQMVAAACPACKILLVEATDNSFTNLMAAVDYATANAKFVSNSYGASEFSGENTYDGHFNKSGVAITVSSGDNGYGVEYPAASRYVTAVGGTSLTSSATARGFTETAWSGAGSGCSAIESKPSWQHDTGCSRRTVADVSAVANPNTGVAVYDSYGSSGGANWFVYGGTSVAAPLVAGIWALAGNPAASAAGMPYANPGGWFDVLTGKNTNFCRSGYLCQAGTGYDGPTGLGTPNGVSGFVGGGTTNTAPIASFTPTDSCTSPCTFTDTSTDAENNITSRSWTFGDGGTSTATNPQHTYSGASGNRTVTLTVTDANGLSNTATNIINVTVPPPPSINLTVTGSKTKGVNSARLTWTGAGAADVYRNGTVLTGGAKTSPYTDTIGKGSGTYTYQVCVGSTCSNQASVTF